MTWGLPDFCGFKRSHKELFLYLPTPRRHGHPSPQQKAWWLSLSKLHTPYTCGFENGLCSDSV